MSKFDKLIMKLDGINHDLEFQRKLRQESLASNDNITRYGNLLSVDSLNKTIGMLLEEKFNTQEELRQIYNKMLKEQKK